MDDVRARIPGVNVLVHPECRHEVVQAADHVGSTEYIIRTLDEAPAGSAWAVGTELNLVKRLAERHPDKTIMFLDKTVCFCSTMNRIDLPHLVWSLESLAAGEVVNQITVDERDRALRPRRPRPDARPALIPAGQHSRGKRSWTAGTLGPGREWPGRGPGPRRPDRPHRPAGRGSRLRRRDPPAVPPPPGARRRRDPHRLGRPGRGGPRRPGGRGLHQRAGRPAGPGDPPAVHRTAGGGAAGRAPCAERDVIGLAEPAADRLPQSVEAVHAAGHRRLVEEFATIATDHAAP